MRMFFKTQWDQIRTNLWILPSLLALIGPVLAIFLIKFDSQFTLDSQSRNGLWLNITPEGVMNLFSMISGSLITAGSVIFSITILVLTLITRQFGSYVLRSFRLQLYPKITIGVLVGTYLYTVVVVASVAGVSEVEWHPTFTMLIGVFLTVLTFVLFILLLHYLSYEVQAPQIVANVVEELRERVLALSPTENEENGCPRNLTTNLYSSLNQHPFSLKNSGYIRAMNTEGILKFCLENDCKIELYKRPGQFITAGAPLLSVSGPEELNESQKEQLHAFFSVGVERTPIDDLEFNLNQLVEIALIALSPGMNHLFVAITCADYIGDSINLLMSRDLPKSTMEDDEGEIRVFFKPFTFEGFVNAALSPLRQNGCVHPMLAIRLLDILKELILQSRNKNQRSILHRHSNAIFHEARQHVTSKLDIASLEERHKVIEELG